jgi:hypothetical protein
MAKSYLAVELLMNWVVVDTIPILCILLDDMIHFSAGYNMDNSSTTEYNQRLSPIRFLLIRDMRSILWIGSVYFKA